MSEFVDCDDPVIPPLEAIERLKEGNKRFLSFPRQHRPRHEARLSTMVNRQNPFAIILGCSDSRMPPEIILDQGLGDLFVVRVAGNVATPTQIGSIEFATTVLGVQLLVVLGHTNCGAVKATIDQVQKRASMPSPNMELIFEKIRPAVATVLAGADTSSWSLEKLVAKTVTANIQLTIKQLSLDSSIIRKQIESQALVIVGAEYCLKTGIVEFLNL